MQARKTTDSTRFLGPQLNAAAGVWGSIESTPVPADRWLGSYFHQHRKKFGSRDRRFIAETVYSLFRHKSFLKDWARHTGAGQNALFLVLCASFVEGLISEEDFDTFLSREFSSLRLPRSFAGHLKKRELASSPGSQEEELALRFSFPLWLVKRWMARFGAEECLKLLETCQTRPPLTLRANVLKISREKLLQIFRQKGWAASASCQSPWAITFKERENLFDSEEFREGYFEIQDEGSQLVCLEIGARPGDLVWDVCAGGGGKSLALAGMMANKGRIIATDIRQNKILDLKKRAKRAGAYNIFPAELGRVSEIHAFKKGGAGTILVDAPCSGTGTLRRNPDAKWKLKEESFEAFHREQLEIVEKALPYLSKGGRLCYATCSLEPEENEQVAEELLQRHPGLAAVSFKKLLPHRDGTDGFFLAILANTQ